MKHSAGLREFMVREVVRRQSLFIQEFDNLVIEAFGAVGLDQTFQGCSVHK